MKLKKYAGKYLPFIEVTMTNNLPVADTRTPLNDAIEYAVFTGGKRIRPVLTLLGAELFGGNPTNFMEAAAAAEFIHASSLVFDDLPCMDNALSRRGKRTVHREFGEGMAILAAVALLNAAYGLISAAYEQNLSKTTSAYNEIVECIGVNGMVGGQAVDLTLAKNLLNKENSDLETDSLKNLKTSALIRLSLCLGAILADADEKGLQALQKFSLELGEAYQISDDLIDLDEDKKSFETDSIKETKKSLQTKINDAKIFLQNNFSDSDARNCLLELCDYVAARNK